MTAHTEKLLPWLGRLTAMVMLGLLGWLGANIFWTVSAPAGSSPSGQMETDAQRAAQGIGNRHLFGQYIAAVGPMAAPSNLKLTGVITAQREGQRAYAFITVEGKAAQLVKEGEEIAPGITLQRVLARQVEIQRNGQNQTLTLPENSKAQTNPANPADANKAMGNTPPTPGTDTLKVAEAGAAATPAAATPTATAEPAKAPVAQITPPTPAAAMPSGPPRPKRSRNRGSIEDD